MVACRDLPSVGTFSHTICSFFNVSFGSSGGTQTVEFRFRKRHHLNILGILGGNLRCGPKPIENYRPRFGRFDQVFNIIFSIWGKRSQSWKFSAKKENNIL